jgi:hypothetical protein
VAHLVLEDLVLDYVFAPGDKIYLRPFQVLDSQDVVLRRVVLDGDKAQGVSEKADGMGFAIGLGIQRSRDVTVENCTISWFHRGLVASQSRGITVRGCNIHSVRSDGLNFAEVQGLLVENNWIHDFVLSRGSGDHADMIQLWTRGTDNPGTDITIRDNLLNSGHAGWTQSIFMRNERVDKGEAGDEMFYRNVAITGNVIINAHSHGISVGATEGLVIARNTLVQNAGSKDSDGNPNLWIPRINVNVTARNVRIERNVTPRIVGYENQPGWQVKDNFLIQNDSRAKPGYYAAVFANPGGDPSDPGSFAYRRGGPLAGAGLGAARLDADPPRPWTP